MVKRVDRRGKGRGREEKWGGEITRKKEEKVEERQDASRKTNEKTKQKNPL